ncbi:MAG: carbohydrate ABC transporter permease [Clostridiaceae bacterium]
MNKKKHYTVSKILINIFLFFLVIIVLYPLYWTIINSLKTNNELFISPFSLPHKLIFKNYISAWNLGLSQYFLNSIYVSFISIAITVFLGALCAYGLSRFDIKAKNLIFMVVLGGLMLSPEVALVSLYKILQTLHLYNTRWAMIIPYIAFKLPFSVFLMRSYFISFPKDMEEAATIDGCNTFQVFYKIVVPISLPIFASTAIMDAIFVWNEFLFALVFVESKAITTIPVGLMAFRDALNTDWTVLLAGITIATLPMAILFLCMQKYFVKGLTSGAVKG